MANFDRSGMTQAGINLMGKAIGGATIQFTKLVLGDGEMTGEILDLQGVVSPKQNVDVTRIERNDNQCTVGGELLTKSVKQGFFWRECGLYAMDPDIGEILYNYAYSTKADYIAASDSGMMEEILVSMVATVGTNTNVDVTIDDSMVLTTKKEFNPLKTKVDDTVTSVKDFGAKGDGVTDDTLAIQRAIDYVFSVNKMSLFFPSGTYNISKPLIVKVQRNNIGGWWHGSAVNLIGESKGTTSIVKTGSDVYTDHPSAEINNKDAVVILFAVHGQDEIKGGTGTGVVIKELFLKNLSTVEDSCVVTGNSCQRMILSDLNIGGARGIIFGTSFSNIIQNIVFYCKKDALVIESGTSNTINNLYSPSCTNPYTVLSAYTIMSCVYADKAKGTIYKVGGFGFVMSGCGTESPEAQYIIHAKGQLFADSLFLHRQTGGENVLIDDCAIIFAETKSPIRINSIYLLEQSKVIGNSYISTSSTIDLNMDLSIDNIFYNQNFSGDPNPKLLQIKQKSNSFSYSRLQGITYARNFTMPCIGVRDINKYTDTTFKSKAIYLDNDSVKMCNGADVSYATKYNVGDILLANTPKESGVLGWVCTNNTSAVFVKDCEYTEIPINNKGTTESRPTSKYVGMQYFDTTLKKPIWWDGAKWIDAIGTTI